MSFIDSLTPKDTEELKPGLFIRKRGEVYRQINPIAWNGKWRLNKQFKWGNLIMIILVLAIAYSYYTETKFSRDLQENPCGILQNITNFCREKEEAEINLNLLGEVEVNDGEGDTFNIQNYP